MSKQQDFTASFSALPSEDLTSHRNDDDDDDDGVVAVISFSVSLSVLSLSLSQSLSLFPSCFSSF